MAEKQGEHRPHVWRFFRAGGFDQVRIDRGADAAAIGALDQKLWVALACPTRGIEFDERTLDLIDADHDGRIRAPEMIDAVAWVAPLLKSAETLARGGDTLALDAIDTETPLGREIRASADAILTMLGKSGAAEISLQDARHVERIYEATPFNGDGIITLAAAAEDEATRLALIDVMACCGSEADRSRQPGVSQPIVDRFFAEAAALVAWHDEAEAGGAALLPLGDATDAAAALVEELRAKLDDYFTRARLAAFDPHAADALNPPLAAYEALSGEALAAADAALAALPVAHIEAGRPLSLGAGLNPAWQDRIVRFGDTVAAPLGARDTLAEADWETIKTRFAAHAAWVARKPATAVEPLGVARLKALLDPAVKARIDALVARDKALEPQMNAVSQVEKLVRFKRDLLPLLNNFVSFKDFYTRAGKAVFQAGTLYLDGRSCDLCIKVEDETKHAVLATLSRIYLAYCRCVRDGGNETLTIAAAFTAGDSDNLIVGRNGVFYDRTGRDWDATIVKIVEHPISLRQAFWLPYRQFARFIATQVQRFAAARAASSQSQMAAQSVSHAAAAIGGSPTPATPAAQQQAFDAARFAGIFAAIGLAIGAIGTAIASVVTGFLQLVWWQMPLALAGLVLIVSGPSCVIAAMKLRSRNLGPLLDASGWAVNTRLRINLPFGRTLTALAQLPEHAERTLSDPYAEKKRPWGWYLAALIVVLAGVAAWRFGWVNFTAARGAG